MLGSVTNYLLCSFFPWTGVHSLTRWKLASFRDYLYYPWVTDSHIVCSMDMSKLSKSLCQVPLKELLCHSFHEHTSLGSPKGTHCLNPKRYHGAPIENTYYYRLPSTMTQSIGNIWSTYDLTYKSKSLLTLVQTQYSIKVEKQHNETTWWGHDYLIALSHDYCRSCPMCNWLEP